MPHPDIADWMKSFALDLSAIKDLKFEGRWAEVNPIVGKGLYSLFGADANVIASLTATELLAALARRGPTYLVPYKLILAVCLFKEAGDYATAQYPPAGGYGWHEAALQMLLEIRSHEPENEYSPLLPTVESLLTLLGDTPICAQTKLLLAREYERLGYFGKTKEQLVEAVKMSPGEAHLLALAIATLERLNTKRDEALIGSGLSRSELNSWLSELRLQKESKSKG